MANQPLNPFAAPGAAAAPAPAFGGATNPAAFATPQQAGFGVAAAAPAPAAFAVAIPAQGGMTPMQAGMAPMQAGMAPAPAQIPAVQNAVEDVSLDDDIQMAALDKFPKLTQNEVARVAFVLFDGKNSPMLKMSETFYAEVGGQGVYFASPKHNPELLKACVQRFGEPRRRFGTILLKYNTDKNGALLPNASFQLYAFVFPKDKFQEFKTHHTEWGLHQHDLLFTCTEPHFQKTQTAVARECLYRGNPALAAEISQNARTLYDSYLNRYMGNVRPDNEIIMILNGQLPPTAGGRGAAPGATPSLPGVNPVNPFAAGGAQMQQQQPGVGGGATTDFAHLVAQGTQS